MIDTAKVLAMSMDEQYCWVFHGQREYGYEMGWRISPEYRVIALGGLAFRLRDEVFKQPWGKLHYYRAIHRIYEIRNGVFPKSLTTEEAESNIKVVLDWYIDYAQPIHWILSSLIAKEK